MENINHILNIPHRVLRKGDTGVGYTFETLLGLRENNHPYPDYEGIEIKTKRKTSKSMTTLFCYGNKSHLVIPLKEIINTYGYSKGDRISLNTTVTNKTNNQGFTLQSHDDTVSISSESETLIQWGREDLNQRFRQKIPKLLLVYAHQSKGFVTFTETNLFHNNKDIGELISNGDITVDLRCYIKNGKIRDRGIAFRTRHIDTLFT